MPFRPASERIESLRRTLVQVENDHQPDTESVAQLKRIVLQRIAVLELDLALEAKPPRA